jgi:hypothetical protein
VSGLALGIDFVLETLAFWAIALTDIVVAGSSEEITFMQV